jgi:HTH-type transcriptional regulator, competence development regulator
VAPSMGVVLRQAREVRQLSAGDAARAAGISPAYLNRLENDAVKKPSPHVLHQLSEALVLPYDELMRLSGYRVPGATSQDTNGTVGAALFADLSEGEQEELLEYLAWYRARRRSKRNGRGESGPSTASPSNDPRRLRGQ